ncbi:Histone-lysine N-methyltransferase, H3 lysine-9 specific SUVH4 [Apostasia shenzhenica]|uniref:Histone-lysine N-methyltransferase, H3 lysine-9 specific SUVH4 n=1 Tax=Apostasia shenzhenica TaxID=1088818 RepID=A0A2I0AGV9_9ASPA|nr:Histone-lysine N-methyltransferase, H3 lysine-9 specific SUVH4 [Apostasia shenzhenica]
MDCSVVSSPEREDSYSEANRGRRRSARNVGKERPFYGTKREDAEGNLEISKKRKICRGKKVSRSPAAPLLPNGSVDSVDSNNLCVEYGNKNLGDVSVSHGTLNDGSAVPVEEAFRMIENLGEPGHASNGSGKSAYVRVKEILRAFNTNYLQFVQEEELRVKKVEEAILKLTIQKHKKLKGNASKSSNGCNLDKSEAGCRELEPESQAQAQAQAQAVNLPERQRGMGKAGKLHQGAWTLMKSNGCVLYPEKRIGQLPGIDVGNQFFSRAEMVVLGLHSHWLNGIDFMGEKYAKSPEYRDYKFPLAICIVLSGVYEDDLDNSEDVIYTGQGGNDLLGRRHQIQDQKMERGNLALKNSMSCDVPVRVIRGHESSNSYCGKVYTYDGLYKVVKYWAEKGVSGFTVFKYRLSRLEGQPTLTTNQVKAEGLYLVIAEDLFNGPNPVEVLPPLMYSFSSASFLNRLLTFRLSTDPRRTSTSTSTANPPPQPDVITPSQSDRPIFTFNPLDLEFAEQLPDPANDDTSGAGINHPDWKRTWKIVQTVGLGRMGVAVTLMVNAPAVAAAH